jgi:hypothetical protein
MNDQRAGITVSIAMSYGTDGRVRAPAGGDLSLPQSVQTGSGAHPASYSTSTGASIETKRPGLEADHSPPSSAEMTSTLITPLLPHASSWRGS